MSDQASLNGKWSKSKKRSTLLILKATALSTPQVKSSSLRAKVDHEEDGLRCQESHHLPGDLRLGGRGQRQHPLLAVSGDDGKQGRVLKFEIDVQDDFQLLRRRKDRLHFGEKPEKTDQGHGLKHRGTGT